MDSPSTVCVLGSGSWGTAIVKMLSEAGHTVHWWMRHPEAAAHVQTYGHNPRYLSDVQLNTALVKPTSDVQEAIKEACTVFVVVPSAFVKPVLEEAGAGLEGKTVVSGVKGIIPDDLLLITDYLEDRLGLSGHDLAILAGPCHAEEIALERQSYLTIGSASGATATRVATMLKGRYLSTSVSTDLYGLEYAAILKNVIAIACGIGHGLGYGDNFLAVLVSAGLMEMDNFLLKAAPAPGRRISASGYTGDTLVTCYSPLSRNRTFGAMIGRGYSVQAAQMEMNMVAEGYYAVRCLYELNKRWQAEMPVVHSTYRILYERASPMGEFGRLAAVLE